MQRFRYSLGALLVVMLIFGGCAFLIRTQMRKYEEFQRTMLELNHAVGFQSGPAPWWINRLHRFSDANPLEVPYRADCRGDAASDETVARLSRIGTLRRISLSPHPPDILTNDGLASLGRLRLLEELVVFGPAGIDDDGFRFLDSARQLRLLRLAELDVTDAVMARISNSMQLKELALQLVPVTDAGISRISHLPNIEGITLRQTNVTAECLQSIGRMTNVQHVRLELSQAISSIPDFTTLENCREIKELSLVNVPVTDDDLAIICRLNNLTTLWLSGTDVTDDGLSHLLKLPHLHVLAIEHSTISDAGIEVLVRLPSITRVYVGGTAITHVGAQRFMNAKPGVRMHPW